MNLIAQKNQKGTALVTSLLMVLVISILGIAVGQQVISLRKVSTANYDHTLSLNNAESALAEANNFFNAYIIDPDGLEMAAVNLNPTAHWWRTDSNWASSVAVSNVSEGNPVYLMENAGYEFDGAEDKLDPASKQVYRHYYRVTAKGQGKGEAVAYLQSYYMTLE